MESTIPIDERFDLGFRYTDKEEAKQFATNEQIVITDPNGWFYVTNLKTFYNGLFQLDYKIV